jgi:hypothetical protein
MKTRYFFMFGVVSLISVLFWGCCPGPRSGQFDIIQSNPDKTTDINPETAPPPTTPAHYQITPCADNATLCLSKQMPVEVQLNAPFDYTITVSNTTDNSATNVVVTEHLAKHYKALKTSPKAVLEDHKLIWRMGTIPARSARQITVRGIGTQASLVQHCSTMTYTTEACAQTKVVEPALALAMTVPTAVGLCDAIPMKLVVKNIGTGPAKGTKIQGPLPAGLATEDDQRQLALDVGTLAPGQSREFSINLKATKTGTYQNLLVATGAGGLETQSNVTHTTVGNAVLVIDKSGPSRRYLERPAVYQITITNTGNMTAQNVHLEDTIPTGMRCISVDRGGAQHQGRIVWDLPSLRPNDSHSVRVAYESDQEGTFSSSATVTADCVPAASDSATLLVKGIAALLVELIDIEDPIELGEHETYVITTTNQGTTVGTNISIVCILEDNVEYSSSSGPTTASVQGNTVTFRPLARLEAKTEASWHVVVKAKKPGDVRFKVAVNSDQLSRPVTETEATELYE